MASDYQPPLPQSPQQQKSKALPWVLGGCAVLLLGAIVLGVGGYGYYRWRNAKAANDNSNAEPTRGSQPHESATSAESNSANSNQSSAQASGAGTPTTWEATASSLTGNDGKGFTLMCSPGGTAHSVWGSGVYTSDSSICTAAVHAGLITYERGGTVTIELRPGRPIYGASESNGVTSSPFGAFRRSFIFQSTKEREQKEAVPDDVTLILWNTPGTILAYEAGKTHKFKCPAKGKEGAVWGTDVYTADSSICPAAVHAGQINLENGGTVTIELRPGQASYQGTTRNGVKTNEYGAYAHSFVFR
jgi:hypothetical protein